MEKQAEKIQVVMENSDSHGYIIVLMSRSASVHFPLKDRQLNTLHLAECTSTYQNDELMIQSQP